MNACSFHYLLIQRKQLLEGNWEVNEGAAFVEFDPSVHVVPPFEIPLTLGKSQRDRLRLRFGELLVSGLLLIRQDETLIIYRELYQKGLTGEGLRSTDYRTRKRRAYRSVAGVLDTAAWARTGYNWSYH